MTATLPGIRIEQQIHFKSVRRGRKQLTIGQAPVPAPPPLGRVSRLARLMALAIRFDGLLRRGELHDYADLARFGHVTRASSLDKTVGSLAGRLARIPNGIHAAEVFQMRAHTGPCDTLPRTSCVGWLNSGVFACSVHA